MDNEEKVTNNNVDNTTSDLPVDPPAEETPEATPEESPDETIEEAETDTEDNSGGKTTYANKNNFHNNAARRMDNLNRKINNASKRFNKAGKKLNDYANKKPNSRLAKAANGLGNGFNKMGSGLGKVGNRTNKINDGMQNANNVANAAEDPLGTATDAAKEKVKEKAKDTAEKATKVAKTAVKKAILTAIAPLLPWIIGILLLLFLIIIIVCFIASIAGGGSTSSSDNSVAITSGECGFTLSQTSLSRDEYIDAIKKYSSKSKINADFVNNAGNIYDKAISMKLNPELVVIRAIAESGATSTSAPYNYWGIGCTNKGGGKDCHSYKSFMDGVNGYLKNISKYTSLNNMMSKYSYLGDYWYNPGSGGEGGCYYANIIYDNNPPARVKTACQKGKTCSGNSCIKTTKEEQDQYTKWQVEKNMASIRERVFGLKFNEGVACNASGNGTLVDLKSYPEGHKGLKMLTSSLSSSQITQLNNYIKSSVDKSGYGTGAGVAAAGQSLIYGMRQFGYYLPYYWGGGHGDGASRIGVSSYLGTSGRSCSDRSGICYHHHSFDCSGFVSWSIKNGCKSSFSAEAARTFNSSKYGKVIPVKEAKPGDIMATSGHVILVVKNNGDGTVITAHSTGSGDEGNIVFVKRNGSDRHAARDMSNWYKKNCDKKR